MYLTNREWYINGNTLTCNFNKYLCKIASGGDKDFRIFRVEIWNDNRFVYSYYFSTLEDAIEFCETIVSKCKKYDDLINEYDNYK